MPRGGARKGSGRKRLGNMRVPVYLDPDTVSLARIIATIEKTSTGAAIKKMIFDPDFKVLPAPNAPDENHYFVTLDGRPAILQILKNKVLLQILENNQKGS